MKRWLRSLWRPRVLVFSEQQLGQRLRADEVLKLLRGARHSPAFRLIVQTLELQRQACQSAVQDKSNLAAGQTAFEAGAAACCADLLQMLCAIEAGGDLPPDWQRWFAPPTRDKRDPS